MWWKLLIPMVLFSAGHAAKEPAFLVTFPAVIPAASRATFCVHLLYPNETLRTSVFLDDDSGSTTLLTSVTKKPVFDCFRFQLELHLTGLPRFQAKFLRLPSIAGWISQCHLAWGGSDHPGEREALYLTGVISHQGASFLHDGKEEEKHRFLLSISS
ncbi:pregnancy zone protein-like [Arapaima gigas]